MSLDRRSLVSYLLLAHVLVAAPIARAADDSENAPRVPRSLSLVAEGVYYS